MKWLLRSGLFNFANSLWIVILKFKQNSSTKCSFDILNKITSGHLLVTSIYIFENFCNQQVSVQLWRGNTENIQWTQVETHKNKQHISHKVMLGVHWGIAWHGNDSERQWEVRDQTEWTKQLVWFHPCYKILSAPWKLEIWLYWIQWKWWWELWRWEFEDKASYHKWLVFWLCSVEMARSFILCLSLKILFWVSSCDLYWPSNMNC